MAFVGAVLPLVRSVGSRWPGGSTASRLPEGIFWRETILAAAALVRAAAGVRWGPAAPGGAGRFLTRVELLRHRGGCLLPCPKEIPCLRDFVIRSFHIWCESSELRAPPSRTDFSSAPAVGVWTPAQGLTFCCGRQISYGLASGVQDAYFFPVLQPFCVKSPG